MLAKTHEKAVEAIKKSMATSISKEIEKIRQKLDGQTEAIINAAIKAKEIEIKTKFETGDVKANIYRTLANYASAWPDAFREAGLNPDLYKIFRTEARKYGCIGSIVSIGHRDPDTEMINTHEFYNTLVNAVLPFIEAHGQLTSGPERAKMDGLITTIDAKYDAKAQLWHRRHSLQKDKNVEEIANVEQEIKKLEDEIKKLKNSKYELTGKVIDEFKELKKNNKAKIDELESKRTTAFNMVCGNTEIYSLNKDRIKQDVIKAIKRVLEAPIRGIFNSKLRYHYADRKNHGRPNNIETIWDGAGALSVEFTKSGEPTCIDNIYNGTNKLVKLRKAVNGDDAKFASPRRFSRVIPNFTRVAQAGGNPYKNLWVVSLKSNSGNENWYEALVKIHRPITESPGDEIVGAKLIRRKIGLHYETNLIFSIRKDINTVVNTNTKTLEFKEFVKDHPLGIQICKWNDPTLGISTFVMCNSAPEFRIISDQNVVWSYPPPPQARTSKKRRPYRFQTLNDKFELSKRLNHYVTRAGWKAKEYIAGRYDEAAKKMVHNGLGPDALPSELSITYKTMRGELRRIFYEWCDQLAANDINFHDKLKAVTSTLSKYTVNHQMFTTIDGKEVEVDWRSDVDVYDMMAIMVKKHLGLQEPKSKAFAALMVFNQTYKHLYHWAAMEREKGLRYRNDIYRRAATYVLKSAGSIIIPDGGFKTRFISENQAIICPSEFISALENYASKHRITVTKVKSIKLRNNSEV